MWRVIWSSLSSALQQDSNPCDFKEHSNSLKIPSQTWMWVICLPVFAELQPVLVKERSFFAFKQKRWIDPMFMTNVVLLLKSLQAWPVLWHVRFTSWNLDWNWNTRRNQTWEKRGAMRSWENCYERYLVNGRHSHAPFWSHQIQYRCDYQWQYLGSVSCLFIWRCWVSNHHVFNYKTTTLPTKP